MLELPRCRINSRPNLKDNEGDLFFDVGQGERSDYLKRQLITYIGNKRSLLPFINEAVEEVKRRLGKSKLHCIDLFSGTGVVARLLKQHSEHLLVNDLEIYSQITNQCYLTNHSSVDWTELLDASQWLHSKIEQEWAPGWIAEMYAPAVDEDIQFGERVFYTRRNAIYLDTARRALSSISEPLQNLFLAPLLARASVHANTSGVFKGFYKDKEGRGQFGGHGKNALTRIMREIELVEPVLSRYECSFEVHRTDANTLVNDLSGRHFDLAYLDPPYNQHPYGSNYFMLNLIATNERPSDVSNVSGIPVSWNRSKYNQKSYAASALFDVIEHCPASHILISYNSEGFISKGEFLSNLESLGNLSVMATPYNTFRGSRNLRERAIHVTEYLYLLEKRV